MESIIAHRPDFFIAGTPKAGTTSLYEYLEDHPEVLMSTTKEPNYFSTDLYRPKRLSTDQYLSLFASAKRAKRVGEASATYIYSAIAPKLIHEFSPEARIIMILRNPVNMIYSLHAQHIWNGREDILDFEDALAAEEDRKMGLRLPPCPPPVQMLFYRERGKYASHVRSYLETFGRERVLILIFEEFIANTAQNFVNVCEFLEIDSRYTPNFEVHNANKTLRSVRLRRLPMSATARMMSRVLPKPLRDRAKNTLVSINTKVEQRAPMGAELRKQLEREFEESIDELSTLLGRDLSKVWKPKALRRIESLPHADRA